MNILFLLLGPVWDNFWHLIDLLVTIVSISGAVAPDFIKKYGKKILLYFGIGLIGVVIGVFLTFYTLISVLGVQ
ncbi:hypothetical protein P4679_30775 [Priestia megaterium]|uniref:hypothetical protein n=1 Tax=Priestia megaterium TaxID=1404 RepID=UPI002E1A81B1|nr:hypothetical protein [Priestia megaterium]